MAFRDRHDAGLQLAEQLEHHRDADPIVLAMPRGGVPVGFEVARRLGAPLDVVVVRKLGAPGQPEFGIGAVAEGGVTVLDEDSIRRLRLGAEELDDIAGHERAELERRVRRYRGDRPEPGVRGRTAIVVDDGLATGVSARAAVQAVRRRGPRHLVLAVPVAAPDTARRLEAEADEVVCLHTPRSFRAVGAWYRDFAQTTDAEVLDLLERARQQAAT